ncbi:VOC family protein [Paraferrimonas sedimenticola]|uniref:VOC domain-containing protein n=1 Tax=Paraferrimonas sedimenticola TaxID=375674 RepID=A0AA37RWA3_9GAMM|nr:hypothetical protein [Paraferrimonas sedimenticola]GLP96273.1 hypothetical protein GCM10007895_15790 [Paraferrimonas sedimenticola]
MTQRQLTGVRGATLVAKDIAEVAKAYTGGLHFSVTEETQVSPELAECWGAPSIAGQPMLILAAANGNDWLRLVQDPSAVEFEPLKRLGWMSLEINVRDVDSLRQSAIDSGFEVIGEPAYLAMSDAIKAMQLIGPAGEVCYMTQIDREVPPFELPQTNAKTGDLFIPVLACADRDQTSDFYQDLHQADKPLKFDTKVTVLNRAWKRPIDSQYPLATLQMGGLSCFEFDQLPQASANHLSQSGLPSGIAIITLEVQDLDAIAKRINCPVFEFDETISYQSRRCIMLKGPSGEWLELIAQKATTS